MINSITRAMTNRGGRLGNGGAMLGTLSACAAPLFTLYTSTSLFWHWRTGRKRTKTRGFDEHPCRLHTLSYYLFFFRYNGHQLPSPSTATNSYMYSWCESSFGWRGRSRAGAGHMRLAKVWHNWPQASFWITQQQSFAFYKFLSPKYVANESTQKDRARHGVYS